jgi:SET domain-containing protein
MTNIACSPNAEVETGVDDQGSVWARIVALRDIEAGEEIAYDYGFPVEHAIPCQCGSPECRGLIIDADARVPSADDGARPEAGAKRRPASD